MFKQSKVVKATALLAILLGSGHLCAVVKPPAAPPAAPAGALPTVVGGSGTLAAPGLATTGSSTVLESSLMAIKVTKILGLVGAVTAEAAAAMTGSDAGILSTGGMEAQKTDGGVKMAASTGSKHRASAWIRASFGAVDNATSGQKWNGQSYLTMIGADYKFNKMFCAGLGLSYSRLNGRTEFNNGQTTQDTYGVNPYLIIVPHKNFNFEFVGGYSMTNAKDQRDWISNISAGTDAGVVAAQNAAAAAPAGGLTADQAAAKVGNDAAAYYGAGGLNGALLAPPAGATNAFTGTDGKALSNRYKSSPKSQAVFGGVFANFVNTVGKTTFNGQVGYIIVQSKMKKYKESSASQLGVYKDKEADQGANTYKAGTVTGKITLLHQMTPSVAPFVNLHAQYDVQQNKGVAFSNGSKSYTVGRSAFGAGGGFHVRNDDAISGSLEFDYTARGQLKTYVSALRLHYGF